MIAFLVQAHADPAMARRLVARLAPHAVFLHLDAKTPAGPAWDALRGVMIADRHPVYWGGFSQVDATAALIRAALATGRRYSRLVLISGACYPCRPLADLEALFEADPARNFLRVHAVAGGSRLAGLTERHWLTGRLLPVPLIRRFAWARQAERIGRALWRRSIGRPRLRRWRHPHRRFHGSNWWALTPEAAALALDAYDRDGALVRAYRNSLAADEQFFHTVLANSPLAATLTEPVPADDDYRTFKAANLHLVDRSLSRWFGPGDEAEIAASGRWFVRKVRSGHSDALLDRLDAAIGISPAGDAAATAAASAPRR